MIKTKYKNRKSGNGGLTRIAEALSHTDEKIPIALAVLMLFSQYGDVSLASLVLVYLITAKKRTTKYIIGIVSTVHFSFTFLHTAEYVPYISFILVYFIAEYLLDKNGSKAVYPAVITFAAAKTYLLSFGYEGFYWAVFAVEVSAVILLPDAVEKGFEILHNNQPISEFIQLFDTMAALLIVALALDGVKLNGLRLSAAFLLGAAFFYGVKNNVALSLTAVWAMMLSICTERHFLFLFAGYAVIYIMGTYLLNRGWQGYIILAAGAMAVCVLFISQFNSIVFVTTTCCAVVLCIAAVKTTSARTLYAEGENIIAGEKEYLDLLGKIQKLNRCFSFLGHTVIDISQLIAKDFVPDQTEDMVASEVCRKCKNNPLCWQENFSYTQNQFSQYAYNLAKGKNPQFDSLLLSRCDKTEQLIASFMSAGNLTATQRLLASAARHNQKILQNQFISMAEILRQITVNTGRSGTVNTMATAAMDRFLQNIGKKVNHCLCYQNRDKCVISTSEDYSPQEIYRIKTKLEGLYNTNFNLPVIEQEEDNIIYTFCQTPEYRCEYSSKSVAHHGNCGDCCEFFETEDTAFVVLADGMGTGSFAAAESRTAVEMLKSMLCASVHPLQALEIINIAINLKGTGQSCVAVDILAVDLYTGKAEIYKAGGAQTVFIGGDRAKILYKDSLPVGILKDTKTACVDISLRAGDSVVLVSDGVETDEALLDKLFILNRFDNVENTAQVTAQNNISDDDATAAAVKLVRA